MNTSTVSVIVSVFFFSFFFFVFGPLGKIKEKRLVRSPFFLSCGTTGCLGAGAVVDFMS